MVPYNRRSYLRSVAAGGIGAWLLTPTRVVGHVDDPPVWVSITETNAPVRAGAHLEVTAMLDNRTDSTLTRDVYLLTGEETVHTTSVTIGAGESVQVTLGYETYPVTQDVTFPITVATEDHSADRQVGVYAGDEPGVQRVHPAEEISVQPGTTVMFEVASPLLGGFGGAEWEVKGEYVGPSMGPWNAAYYDHEGTDYWQHTFESTGTHEVTASVDPEFEGGTGTHTTDWTVHVTADGTSSPSVDATRPSGEALTPEPGETVALEVDVSSSDARLERVVWWMHQHDVVLAVDELEGTSDTATYSSDWDSFGCHTCGVYVWVIDENGGFLEVNPWWVDEEGTGGNGALSVSILGTNAPVHAGDVLEVTARLENEGSSTVTQNVQLIAGETVDTASVTVDGGESEQLTLGYETYPVRQDVTFTVTVATEDGSDDRTVEVYGTG